MNGKKRDGQGTESIRLPVFCAAKSAATRGGPPRENPSAMSAAYSSGSEDGGFFSKIYGTTPLQFQKDVLQ